LKQKKKFAFRTEINNIIERKKKYNKSNQIFSPYLNVYSQRKQHKLIFSSLNVPTSFESIFFFFFIFLPLMLSGIFVSNEQMSYSLLSIIWLYDCVENDLVPFPSAFMVGKAKENMIFIFFIKISFFSFFFVLFSITSSNG
jgi:hypothetical protein